MADPTPREWAATLLRQLGIHQTPGAVQALTGWAAAEGGHWNNSARFNPLNTTQPMPGAGNTGSQGNIKVYRDWDQGVRATARTLRNGRYGSILSALRAGDPAAVASAIGSSPWGTSGDLARRAILGTPRVAGVHALRTAGAAAAGGGSSGPVVLPGVDGSSPDFGPASSTATDALASLLTRQQTGRPVSGPAPPGYAAHAVMPQGYVAPSSGGPAVPSQPGVDAMLEAIRTQGGEMGGQDDATGALISAASGPGPGVSGSGGEVRVAPNANRAGVGLQPGIVKLVRVVAARAGHPLTIGTGTNHNRLTVDGNVSDHWSGNAADIPTTPGEQNIQLGRNALMALGMPRAQAEKAGGGIYNLPYGQHRRIQVIFATNQGGNHYNHVHVGVTAK